MVGPRAFVLGHPVAHSRSPMLHGHWLATLGLPGQYELRDVPPAGLAAFVGGMRAAGYVGGNVTVPHKVAVLDLVDQVDATARAVGAVNTIWTGPDGLVGGNTDVTGFMANLDDQAPGWAPDRDRPAGTAVVLGAGGAARAAVWGLLRRGLCIHVVNRTHAAGLALARHFAAAAGERQIGAHPWSALPDLLPHADLLVNTTSLGMVGKPPLPIDLAPLRPGAVVYDIVYVPLQTPLLQQAAERGHRVVDGLGMLLHQAVPGFAHWFGVTPTVTPALRALMQADIPE